MAAVAIAWTCYIVYGMLFPLSHHGVNVAFLSPKRCVNKMANMRHQWRMQNSATAVRQTCDCVAR